MNTFLPFPDFQASARSLDRLRLGKQRVEVLQMLRGQWPHHPASLMWKGHERSLARYGIAVCQEWRGRGYHDTCLEKIKAEAERFLETGDPAWLGREIVHRAYQSNLVRKDPVFYGPMFPGVPGNMDYVWPCESRPRPERDIRRRAADIL